MGNTGKPSAPTGLGARGRRFWREILAIWDLTTAELELLAEVCRLLDEIDALRALVDVDGLTVTGSMGQTVMHPALVQLRASRALVGKLLAQLELPDEEGEALATPTQARARKAAQSRWNRDPYKLSRERRRGSA